MDRLELQAPRPKVMRARAGEKHTWASFASAMVNARDTCRMKSTEDENWQVNRRLEVFGRAVEVAANLGCGI